MKNKIGANSATEIIEIAKASPFVISITYSNTAKFRTHIPICKIMLMLKSLEQTDF